MNKLEKETSPYLLEHKHNPVNWYAWNPKSLKKSKEENKPILLSIGYSACHWCHVMARESFQNPQIAKIMNDEFINIKVDREERPDLDAIYQKALMVMGEQGGWPLTIFLMPNKDPFWGGTYFPPIPKFGRPAFPDILRSIAHTFKNNSNQIKNSASSIKNAINKISSTTPSTKINNEISNQISLSLVNIIDKEFGGIQGAPKFPNIPVFENIFRYGFKKNKSEIKKMIFNTLQKMSLGGIYDHIGGGFSRYSTDYKWLIPHFEKMLYDNAQIVEFLTTLWQENNENLFKDRVFETIEWVLREMKTNKGGLATAIDADSDGEEGKFYVWSKNEIKNILKRQAEDFCKIFDISQKGNWENKNILNRKKYFDENKENKIKKQIKKIFIERQKRNVPLLDDKVLADCNGLMISALANAGWTFNISNWLKEAEKIYNFIKRKLFYNSELYHSWRNNEVRTYATIEDYGSFLKSSITLYETTGNKKYLNDAKTISKIIIKQFKDEKGGGFFINSNKTNDIIIRLKSIHDSSIPSGISLVVGGFSRLYYLTGDDQYYNEANGALESVAGDLHKNFFGFASLMNAYDVLENGIQIIVIKKKGDIELINQIKKKCIPNKIYIEIENSLELPKKNPAYGKKIKNEKTTVYICRKQTCSLPITNFKEFTKELDFNKIG